MDNPGTGGPAGNNNLEPGYASSLAHAAKQFKVFFLSFLLVTIAFFAITFVLRIPQYFDVFAASSGSRITPAGNAAPLGFGWYLLYLFIVTLIEMILYYGYTYASIKAARGEKPSIIDLLRPAKRFFSMFFSALLFFLIIFVSSLFLLIPGIFLGCRLMFIPFLVVDKKSGPVEAIGQSWEMTRGHFWKIFALGLTILIAEIVLYFIAVLICLPFVATLNDIETFNIYASNLWIVYLVIAVIGIPTGMYVTLIWGSLYHSIQMEKDGGNMPNSGTVIPDPNLPSAGASI